MPLARMRLVRVRRVRRLMMSRSALPRRILSSSSSSLSRVSVAPSVPMLTDWPAAESWSRPSKLLGSLVASPLTMVSSNRAASARTFSVEHLGSEVLDVAAGRLEEVVDVRVAAEDFERSGLLGERRGVFGPRVADVVEGRGWVVFDAVVAEAVSEDRLPRDERQRSADDAYLVDEALHERVV